MLQVILLLHTYTRTYIIIKERVHVGEIIPPKLTWYKVHTLLAFCTRKGVFTNDVSSRGGGGGGFKCWRLLTEGGWGSIKVFSDLKYTTAIRSFLIIELFVNNNFRVLQTIFWPGIHYMDTLDRW